MNKNLTEKLIEKYPKLYSGYNESPRESLMCFGFECGDGWFGLIDNLSQEIQRYCDSKKDMPQVIIIQVKEKFGGLRYYIGGADDYVYNLVDEAERKSYEICMRCGKEGKIRTEGWIVTLCDGCMYQN